MGKEKPSVVLQILNALFFLVMVLVNALANILPINGRTTASVSDSFPNLFAPAGITFAIWGVIYLLLLIFSIYQFKGIDGKVENKFVTKIGVWFILSSIVNACWIFAWHHGQILITLVLMLILLFSLIVIYTNLGVGKANVPTAEKALVHIPFSVYLGWITVATIANVTTLLVKVKWDGFGFSPVFWMVTVVIIATIITFLVLMLRRDVAYALVIIWAFIGIIIKRSAEVPRLNMVYYAVMGCIAVVVILMIISLFRKQKN